MTPRAYVLYASSKQVGRVIATDADPALREFGELVRRNGHRYFAMRIEGK